MLLNIKKIVASRSFKITIITIAIIGAISIIFQFGVFIGFHKASFLFKSGDNFYRNFGERNDRMMGRGFKNEFSGGHGVIGKIIKIDLPSLVVLGQDNIEKVIITNEKTYIRQYRDISSTTNLTLDQYITVLGTPNNQGQIVAKFIRIIPDTSMMKQMSSSTNQ